MGLRCDKPHIASLKEEPMSERRRTGQGVSPAPTTSPPVREAEATDEAERVATGQGFTERLAERVGAAARASAVFGEAVDGQGVTVIPVARAKWGFGGGSGVREDQQGTGGGGGTSVSPVGFIELRAGEAHFRRIHNRAQIAAVVMGTGLSTAIAFRLGRMRRPKAGRAGRAGVKWLVLKPAGMGLRLLRRAGPG
jgi:uncharacterized spore protein YtfJ